ncbi:hypothetical protein [Fodinibius sp.]
MFQRRLPPPAVVYLRFHAGPSPTNRTNGVALLESMPTIKTAL